MYLISLRTYITILAGVRLSGGKSTLRLEAANKFFWEGKSGIPDSTCAGVFRNAKKGTLCLFPFTYILIFCVVYFKKGGILRSFLLGVFIGTVL